MKQLLLLLPVAVLLAGCDQPRGAPTDGQSSKPQSDNVEDSGNPAKLAAEKFAKAFIQDKNVAEAMKLTSTPFIEIEQGREQKPKKLEKPADLKKQLETVVKRHDEIGIREKVTITKVQDASGDVQLDKSTKDVFDPKTDRVFVISFAQNGGFPFELLTLVSSREDQPKVIGFGLYFSR